MPILENPRHEAFAQARAKGAGLDDAYEAAGFAPGNKHASRLALRPEVAERVMELRVKFDAEGANDQAVIAALLRLAEASAALATPAAIKEARLTLMEAHRLRACLALDQELRRARLGGREPREPSIVG